MKGHSLLPRRVGEIESFLVSKLHLFRPAEKGIDALRKRVADDASKRGEAAPVVAVNFLEHYAQPIRECIDELRRRWPEEQELRSRVAEIYFHPSLWGEDKNPGRHFVSLVLTEFLHHTPPTNLVAFASARMEHLFRNVLGNWEDEAHHYLKPAEPGIHTCLELLLGSGAAAIEVFEKLARGGFNYGPLQKATMVWDQKQRKSIPQTLETWVYKETNMGTKWPAVLGHLYVNGRLTYELFKEAVRNMPDALHWMSPRYLAPREAPKSQYDASGRTRWTTRVPNEAAPVLARYGNQLARELSESLDEQNIAFLLHTSDSGTWLEGSWCIVQAAKLFERLKPQTSTYHVSSYFPPYTSEKVIVHLAQGRNSELETAEERKEAVFVLRTFRLATLKALLPLTPRQYPLLLQALNWESAIPLVQTIVQLAGIESAAGILVDSRYHLPDPAKPVFDTTAIREMIKAAGADRAAEILDLFTERCPQAEGIAIQMAAIGGFNAKEVLAAVRSHNHAAVKALGLLPVTKPSEAQERYKLLKEFEEHNRKQKPRLRDAGLVAVELAFHHLAESAGYEDTTRLRAAMEGAQPASANLVGKGWKAGNSEMKIELTDSGPAPYYFTDGKRVKRVPPEFRSTRALAEMTNLLETAIRQHHELQVQFEQMMCSAEPFSIQELRQYKKSPVAMALLAKLVIAVDDTKFGTFDGTCLKNESGSVVPSETGQVLRIAHPYLLHQTAQLATWQEEIVHREWLQPFDQVFRELYLLHPKEESAFRSERFSGISLTVPAAVRLLERCGWQVQRADIVEIRKIDGRRMVAAVWESEDDSSLRDPEYPDSEIIDGAITMKAVSFYQISSTGFIWVDRRNKLKLSEVPPLLFAEVMRDAGFVTAETSEDFDNELPETKQRRMAAVAALIRSMKIPAALTTKEHLTVRGKHATYKIDIDGTITIAKNDKGLSIPKRARAQEKNIFVPFSRNIPQNKNEIALVREIVNAARALAHDDKIEDGAFLKALGLKNSKSLVSNQSKRQSS